MEPLLDTSYDLAWLLNTSTPLTAEDAAESPLDWLAGLWVGGELYALDAAATTETRAVLANGAAAVKWSPRGAYCGGGHRTGVEAYEGHWCVADMEEWTEEEDARGVVRDWRRVSVWDANGFSEVTTYATVQEACEAYRREKAELVGIGQALADAG